MTKIFNRTALIFGLLLTGPALAAETQTMTHEGVTYVYSVTEKGSSRIIEGVNSTNNSNFRLLVSRGRVEGRVGGSPVSFSLREVKPIASAKTVATVTPSTELAAR